MTGSEHRTLRLLPKSLYISLAVRYLSLLKIYIFWAKICDMYSHLYVIQIFKGQLISKCLFEKIVSTKIPTKNLIDSAHYTCWAESIKCFVGILVQTIFSKRHFEINWPLAVCFHFWTKFAIFREIFYKISTT